MGRKKRECTDITGALADRLSDLVWTSGKTQCDICNNMGISQSILSDWMNNKKTPSAEMLCKLADYFETTVDYLLGRTSIVSIDKNKTLYTAEKITGLSGAAIKQLQSWKDLPEYYDILNNMLIDPFFSDFIENVRSYLMLSWAMYSPKGHSIYDIVHDDQCRAMDMLAQKDFTALEKAFIALKSNLNHTDIADFYLQRAQQYMSYVLKELHNKEKGKMESAANIKSTAPGADTLEAAKENREGGLARNGTKEK